MTRNNIPDLSEHPLFGNRKRVLATPKSDTNNNKGKMIVTGVALGLLAIAAFITGLWATNGGTGIGGTLTAWPGQTWQQFLQSQTGTNVGEGLAQQSPWILARVGGVMAYVMSFFSVALGLTMSLRWKWIRNVLHPTATFYLHKILSLLTVSFLVMHLTGLALDNYTNISLVQSLIPFNSSYLTFWTGLGTIALYGSLLVIVTAYLANKLGYKVWRSVHYLTFGIFYISLIHGVMTGSDTSTPWMLFIYVGSGMIVAALTGMRFMGKPKQVKAATNN